VSFYTLEGFLNAKLPVKEIPAIKEGLPSSNDSAFIGIVKDAPHPNAARVFVNWLLSKEGQELYVKVMHQSTRRLDVNTKWLQEHGVRAAKDIMTVEQYHKLRNHLEDKYTKVRIPAAKFAEEVIKKVQAVQTVQIVQAVNESIRPPASRSSRRFSLVRRHSVCEYTDLHLRIRSRYRLA
jgi:ABC-type glycerol-3-phosphate transport system substrate-binding protein